MVAQGQALLEQAGRVWVGWAVVGTAAAESEEEGWEVEAAREAVLQVVMVGRGVSLTVRWVAALGMASAGQEGVAAVEGPRVAAGQEAVAMAVEAEGGAAVEERQVWQVLVMVASAQPSARAAVSVARARGEPEG